MCADPQYRGALKVIGKGFSDENYGIGIKKGKDEKEEKKAPPKKEAPPKEEAPAPEAPPVAELPSTGIGMAGAAGLSSLFAAASAAAAFGLASKPTTSTPLMNSSQGYSCSGRIHAERPSATA